MKKIDVVIIDGNISDIYSKEIYKKLVLSSSEMNTNTIHATTCYLIIKNYTENARCSNVALLTLGQSRDIDNLYTALDWCVKNDILLANLSFGTTHFKDYDKIQETINHFATKGMIFVCASSNSGFTSYPASFSSVIGIVTDIEQNEFFSYYPCKNLCIGTEIVAPSIHDIKAENINSPTTKSNSYAAPYIASLVTEIMLKNEGISLKEIKRNLLGDSYHEPFVPDWISCANIVGHTRKTKATYFFDHISNLDANKDFDTVIIYNNCDESYGNYGDKHLVYLQDNIESCSCIVNEKRFYWTPNCRRNQILQTEYTKEELSIPVVNIIIDESEDYFYLLSEFKNLLHDDGYNSYIISNNSSCVLYNFEYIPIEFLMQSNSILKSFLYDQTYYKQCDLIFTCTNMPIKNIEQNINIEITNTDKLYNVIFSDDEGRNSQLTFESLDKYSIQLIYDETFKFLTV